MGLDWCLNDKIIEEQEHNNLFAEAHCTRIGKEIDEAYTAFLSDKGEEAPRYFPNPITEEFRQTSVYLELQGQKEKWTATRDATVITPMQTLECPAIGVDDEATQWAKNQYKEAQEDLAKNPEQEHVVHFFESYPTLDVYLERTKGMYVASLAKNKVGLGSVTGIAVGPESFRGKIIGYIDWLSDDLKGGAYDSREPDELVAYGTELTEAALRKRSEVLEAGELEPESELAGQIEVVLEAGNWCVFWGENGHAMHAWY